jgi:CheY-like chemotaxis protein
MVMEKRRVLLVDDNIHPMRPVVDALKQAASGLDIHIVTSLRAAVGLVSKTKFDAYLIDLELPLDDIPGELHPYIKLLNSVAPANSGQALTGWLRSREVDVKYAYLTNNAEHLDRTLAWEGKPVHLIAKGSDEASPMQIVETVMTKFKFKQ